MVYFCYSSSLNVYVAYISFFLDSHLATLLLSRPCFILNIFLYVNSIKRSLF